MHRVLGLARRFRRCEEGATLLEYGMLVMLIALLSVVAVKAIGTKISAGFSTADSLLP